MSYGNIFKRLLLSAGGTVVQTNIVPAITDNNGNAETKIKLNNMKEQQGGKLIHEKRENVLKWEDYFMGIAFLSGQRSKDPVTQVGACIVNDEMRIVGTGYNGLPNGCHDEDFPWRKDKDLDLDKTKYGYVCHAEMNAILNKNSASLKGCKIYVSLFPCNECAKLIIQSGIKEVIFYSDKHKDKSSTKAAKKMLRAAHVKYSQHKTSQTKIEIDFDSINESHS